MGLEDKSLWKLMLGTVSLLVLVFSLIFGMSCPCDVVGGGGALGLVSVS